MTFDKQIKRRDLLKTSAMLGIAGAAGSVAPSLLKAEPTKPKEIIVRAWGGPWVEALKAGVSDPFTTKTGIKVRHDLTEDNAGQKQPTKQPVRFKFAQAIIRIID